MQKPQKYSVTTQAASLECTHGELSFDGLILSFRLQENELFSVITQAVHKNVIAESLTLNVQNFRILLADQSLELNFPILVELTHLWQ